jgi:hypothetical protein
MYSLDDLDQGKACEKPYEFEVTNEIDGKGTGLFLSVVGAHAQRVLNLIQKTVDERRVAEAMAEKRDPRGKQVHVRPIKEDIDYSTELVAVRVVGWRGIKEEYSPERAIKLCTINPGIKEQILAASEELRNFPTVAPMPLDSTSGTAPT